MMLRELFYVPYIPPSSQGKATAFFCFGFLQMYSKTKTFMKYILCVIKPGIYYTNNSTNILIYIKNR